MDKQEILNLGKRLYDFSPDEEFDSVLQIIDTARKGDWSFAAYTYTTSLYAETLAKYVDEN